MSKKDVLDTVDIFFEAGKSQPETDEVKNDQQETELPALQAQAGKVMAAHKKNNVRAQTLPAIKPRQHRTPAPEPIGAGSPAANDTVEESLQMAQTPERERISFVLPYEQVEYLKNYKYCRALMDGDPQYTLTEALIEAIDLLRKHSTYDVFERPDFVRAREKKPRR